jgi:hypothetical protein
MPANSNPSFVVIFIARDSIRRPVMGLESFGDAPMRQLQPCGEPIRGT